MLFWPLLSVHSKDFVAYLISDLINELVAHEINVCVCVSVCDRERETCICVCVRRHCGTSAAGLC